MKTTLLTALVAILPSLAVSIQPRSQLSFSSAELSSQHVVDESVSRAVELFSDPVDALLHLQPDLADELSAKRLIQVFGEDEAVWMTEGDKLRLRRQVSAFTGWG